MDNNFYQNDANHHGFIYQNPSYASPSTYRSDNPSSHRHGCIRCENLKLVTIYVKPQVYDGVSSPAQAFEQGTAFVELYKPFVGKGGQR